MRLLISDGEPWPCARAVGYVASGLVHEMCGISLRYIQKNDCATAVKFCCHCFAFSFENTISHLRFGL